ncbi:hypothetical protein BHE74_00036991 [Ensete ventricosum]|nr:hypothetical protein BHE74_00036991 [Ensete ventricosum]
MTRLKCVDSEDPLVPRWSTISGSILFWTEGPLSGEYLWGALHPTLAKQGLHFVSALIDRVHDVGRLVRSQHDKILALRATNKELKASVGQELVATAERQVKELEAEIKRMRAELESHRSQRREFEQEVRLLRSSLDGAQNNQARLKGNVLSLTEAATFLEAELKAEG